MKDIDIELFDVSDSYIGKLDMIDDLGSNMCLMSNYSKSMKDSKIQYNKNNNCEPIYITISDEDFKNVNFGLTLKQAKALRDSLSSMILYLEL